MTNGYEEAKAQRNVLEKLGEKIPGYRGFQDRELRRDVDRQLREHLASEVGHLKSALRDRARSYTDAGKIGALNGFDRLDRQLDGLSQAIRFSDYGATGLFDPVKIGEPELQRLYEFDLSVVNDLAQLEAEIAAVPAPGGDDPGPALDKLQQAVRALDDTWKQRKQVIGNAVHGGQSA
ncbi:MAG TPA: hypothetical protein VIA62_24235 [Thermoanaerobaculia bacterium]|jgi:hypothetical protein|nr:hypothetical protein [Thermoanaerobaculia bacterium]